MSPRFASLCLLSLAFAAGGARAQTPAAADTAPATPAPPAPTQPAEPPAPAATPTPDAAAPAEPPAPATTAAPAAAAPTGWTSVDIERVRAMLREARARSAAAHRAGRTQLARPVVHGDAGAAIAIGASVDAVFVNDPGYDLFADDDVAPRFGVFAAHDLVTIEPRTIGALELGWGTTDDEINTFGDTLRSRLLTHSFFAAVSVRHVLASWLQPQVRLAGGASLVSWQLRADGEPTDEGDAVSPFGSLGCGLLLRTPTRFYENQDGRFAGVSTGLLVEAGYAQRGAVELALDPQDSAGHIASRNAELGTLELSGPYVRTSFVLRF